ncbi:hypothetical protein AMECASPLE_034090 [Ameca splendens]|uniref:Uncharacterized protein n=1 Tax=Ameca splendens TaxID=208324 RepID=A0ABV1ADG0_9TELE
MRNIEDLSDFECLQRKVRALFQESPFLSREDSVSIMDGTDEAVCTGFTKQIAPNACQSKDTYPVHQQGADCT